MQKKFKLLHTISSLHNNPDTYNVYNTCNNRNKCGKKLLHTIGTLHKYTIIENRKQNMKEVCTQFSHEIGHKGTAPSM